jgi:adenylate cyclase
VVLYNPARLTKRFGCPAEWSWPAVMDDTTTRDEAGRLAALERYQIVDTPPEFAYDALTELAAEICGCPVALISLVDDHRQWFKSKYGFPPDFVECPRDVTVCSTTICSNDLLYIPELTADERFKDLPIVKGEPHLRFYCGMPLINTEGHALGTLCVVDFQPRELGPSKRESIRRLAQQTMAQLELRRQLLQRDTLLEEISRARVAAEKAQESAQALLRKVLPGPIAEELGASGHVEPRYHESTTILFADFKDFTRLTESLDPAKLLGQLGQNFSRFDEIAGANRLETLKTIGDAYVCVGGLPRPNRTHAIDACLAALQMQQFVRNSNRQREKLRLSSWDLRIGVNTGSVVAGLIGTRRFTYDIWGNAVNVAQRMEESCEPGRVNVSASTFHQTRSLFTTQERGAVQVKHLGAIDMYFLDRIRPELSADADGFVPNTQFWRTAGVSQQA